MHLPFIAWPEMLLYPWLADAGYAHYEDMIHPYFPGLIWLLQLMGVFHSALLKAVTWAIILLSDVLLFLIVRRFWGKWAALGAVVWYILWQPVLDGNGLWFDLATTPLLLAGFFAHLEWMTRGSRRMLVFTALFFALAFLMKQSIGILVLVFLTQVAMRNRKALPVALLPFLTLAGILILVWSAQGILGSALYWTIIFPLVDERMTEGFTLLPSSPVDLFLALAVFPSLLLRRKRGSFHGTILIWTVFLSLMAFPRWGLFHLQPALAFAAVAFGILMRGMRHFVMVVLVGGLLLVLAMFLLSFYRTHWGGEDQFYNAKLLEMAEQLQEVIGDDSLFIFSGDQLLYVVLGKYPPKPWADWFPWYYAVRDGEIEELLVQSLQRNPPTYVLTDTPISARVEYRYRPERIKNFIDEHYVEVRQFDTFEILKIENL